MALNERAIVSSVPVIISRRAHNLWSFKVYCYQVNFGNLKHTEPGALGFLASLAVVELSTGQTLNFYLRVSLHLHLSRTDFTCQGSLRRDRRSPSSLKTPPFTSHAKEYPWITVWKIMLQEIPQTCSLVQDFLAGCESLLWRRIWNHRPDPSLWTSRTYGLLGSWASSTV